MSERKPQHTHDCDKCVYVGTVTLDPEDDTSIFDIYRCDAHGAGMTVLRATDADEDAPVALPDAALGATLGAIMQQAMEGREEAGVMLLACAIAVTSGAKPVGIPE